MGLKLNLSKNDLIVFMGSMNAMPMMYAIELRRLGYNVLYFVDAKKSNLLSRPENHFPNIDYPYPSWVVELVLPSQIVVSLFPWLISKWYERAIYNATGRKAGCYILNGFYATLTPYLDGQASKVVLSHGSDVDVWANKSSIPALERGFSRRSIFKYLPNFLSRVLIRKIVSAQYKGCSCSDTVVYFPLYFNADGDSVIKRLMADGVNYVPRYDISFEPLVGQERRFSASGNVLEIFSGVRFLFKTFPEGGEGYNKGNDLIIEGIAKYYKRNPNIRVHFVEKGEDVDLAKMLCRKHGISGVIVWHKEMPFSELLSLYECSDVCFDQVGQHWIGAIGAYALWLGKPLIANDDPAVRSGVWPLSNPVCSARSSEDVFNCLVRLESDDVRAAISEQSKIFVEEYMGPMKALSEIFELSG